MLPERSDRNDLEGALVGRCKHHRCRRSIAMGPQPVRCSHTPAIAWDESWEPVLRHRGREVVSDAALVVEELSGSYGTHGMASRVVWSGVAPTVPMEAGKWVAAAGLEVASKDVALGHRTSIAPFSRSWPRAISGHGSANGFSTMTGSFPFCGALFFSLLATGRIGPRLRKWLFDNDRIVPFLRSL